ncbi:MAG: hypothetical protein OXF57_13510, partial [Rhodospirillaceae bacterium]|nr:hypothetical protein [Rhodospirillaceae bacterium]
VYRRRRGDGNRHRAVAQLARIRSAPVLLRKRFDPGSNFRCSIGGTERMRLCRTAMPDPARIF